MYTASSLSICYLKLFSTGLSDHKWVPTQTKCTLLHPDCLQKCECKIKLDVRFCFCFMRNTVKIHLFARQESQIWFLQSWAEYHFHI